LIYFRFNKEIDIQIKIQGEQLFQYINEQQHV